MLNATPSARIISVLSRCPHCASRLRYRSTPTRWYCANCGAVLCIPQPNSAAQAQERKVN